MRSRFSLLFLATILVSCSIKSPESSDGQNPGDEESYSPIVVDPNSQDRITLLNICGALEEKETLLPDYVSQRESMGSTYQETDCEGKTKPIEKFNVTVTSKSSRYEFVADEGSFPLPEVETLNSGVMKEICSSVMKPGFTNPFLSGAQTVVRYRVADTEYCRTDSQNTCVQISRGRMNPNQSSFVINESTIIKFRTARGGKTGFYGYKNVRSFGACSDNKFITKTVGF